MLKGLFITFEGIDCAGKTTALSFASQKLAELGIPHITTFEPGGTDVGKEIRGLLLKQGGETTPDVDTLLVFADRRQHLEKVVWPALERGQWVLCDRFIDATYAYQGGGFGVSKERIRELEDWVKGEYLGPTHTFLLDIPPEQTSTRFSTRGKERDKMEIQDTPFIDRVYRTYQERAEEEPDRITLIDATQPLDEVKMDLTVWLHSMVQLWGYGR